MTTIRIKIILKIRQQQTFSKNTQNLNTTGLLADDTIQMEETHDDCVYQITIKKVYNKNLQGKPPYYTYFENRFINKIRNKKGNK